MPHRYGILMWHLEITPPEMAQTLLTRHSGGNFGSKGAKEAQEVLGRVNSLFAGGELDEDAKDVFFQAIMSVYMDSKKTAREKYTPKKYRKHKDKE